MCEHFYKHRHMTLADNRNTTHMMICIAIQSTKYEGYTVPVHNYVYTLYIRMRTCALCGRHISVTTRPSERADKNTHESCLHAPNLFPLPESSVQTSTTAPVGVSSSSLHSLLLLVSHILCFCLPRHSFPLSHCLFFLLLCHFLPLWFKKGPP